MNYKISGDQLECLKILCVGVENINNFKNVGGIVDENIKNENLCNFWILTYKIQEQYSKEKTYNECKEILYTAQKRNHKKIQFIKDKK